MDQFLELQYITLRKEIEETKARTFRIIIGGATIVPAAQFIAQTYNIATLSLLLPVLVIIITLLFLAENHALMRCGCFIRLHIESTVAEVKGWETWLESTHELDDRRTVDRYLNYSFFLLSGLYYIASVTLAGELAHSRYGLVGLSVTLGVYVALGIWMATLLIRQVKATTTTRYEVLFEKNPGNE